MKGFDWQAGKDFEIWTLEAFRRARDTGDVIVVADVARDTPIAHFPTCTTLSDDRFRQKIIDMGGKNGRYYQFGSLTHAREVIGARACQRCAPTAGQAGPRASARTAPPAADRPRPDKPSAKAASDERATMPLDENAVVAAVCAALAHHGFEILSRAHTSQTGPDIVAARDGVTLYVEAKGATSSREGSKRFGQPYDSTMARINVAEALYTAVAARTRHADVEELRSSIALQDDEMHRRLVAPLEPGMDELSLGRFWVHPRTGAVDLEAPWAW